MRRAQQHRARAGRESHGSNIKQRRQIIKRGDRSSDTARGGSGGGADGERLLGRGVLVGATQRIHGPLGTGTIKKIFGGGGGGGSRSSGGHDNGGSSGQGQSACGGRDWGGATGAGDGERSDDQERERGSTELGEGACAITTPLK